MAIAIGQIGMNAESFYFLSPEEFEEIYKKWSDKRDADLRTSWEQTRLICYWSIYKLKSVMPLKSFMPLAWDGMKDKPKKVKDPERFARLKKEYGEVTP